MVGETVFFAVKIEGAGGFLVAGTFFLRKNLKLYSFKGGYKTPLKRNLALLGFVLIFLFFKVLFIVENWEFL